MRMLPTYTGILDLFIYLHCIGSVSIANSLTQPWCIVIIFYFYSLYISSSLSHHHLSPHIQSECFALAIH